MVRAREGSLRFSSRGERLPMPMIMLLAALLLALGTTPAYAWTFTDVTTAANIAHQHGYVASAIGTTGYVAGGVAAGDYDNDGWVDLYVESGDATPNQLLRNRGDGTFEDVAASAGVALPGHRGSGGTFADIDGDGWLDLIVPGVGSTWNPSALSPLVLFRNRGDGTFEDVTASSGLTMNRDSISAAFGDYDRDGDLDLFITHWFGVWPAGSSQQLWRNDAGTFTDVSVTSDIAEAYEVPGTGAIDDLTFTPNFVDITDDGWPDLLVAGDFGTSKVFVNDQDGTFTETTTPVISDENGMGAAIADYDRDGRLDWFVSSIFDPNDPEDNWGVTGNRLYRNLGGGLFEDTTDAAGVREGAWGWGSTFSDLDNDGHVDLFHVNGWPLPPAFEFFFDPAVCFVNNGNDTFTDRATELGLADTGQGRGVVAFDYDRDGDLDLLITNSHQSTRLYRNDGGNDGNFLRITLRGQSPNTQGIGARVEIDVGASTRIDEIRAGSNYVSQNPAVAHFGLGTATTVDEVRVYWLGGGTTTVTAVAANQTLTVQEPGTCGNGVVDAGEACDTGTANATAASCCNADCTLRVAGAVCRAAAGTCDSVETCTGAAATCPADALEPAGTVCRPAAGQCDVDEQCTGVDTACPVDLFEPNGTACDDGIPCTADACDAGTCAGTLDVDICLDEFQCYATRRDKEILSTVTAETVTLADEFESGPFRLKKPRQLCKPADAAAGGTVDPDTNLQTYLIRPNRDSPRHVQQVGILVTNALGTLSLDTRKPDLLLLPAADSPTAPPAAPDPLAHDVDAYKCYKVRITKGTPPLPKPLQISASDAFTGIPVLYDVKKVRHLCVPVGLNGGGLVEPARYLTCYKARPARGEPKHVKRIGHFVTHALGTEGEDTKREDEFCLPSTRVP